MPGAWRAARPALDPHRREAGLGAQALYGPDPNTSLENDAICGLRAAHCRVFGAISYERVEGARGACRASCRPGKWHQAQRPRVPGRSGRATREELTCARDIAPQAAEPRALRLGSTWNAGGPHCETPWPVRPAARHRLTDGELVAGGRVANPLKRNDWPHHGPRHRDT